MRSALSFKPGKSAQFCMKLDQELYEATKEVAKERGISKCELARHGLRLALAENTDQERLIQAEERICATLAEILGFSIRTDKAVQMVLAWLHTIGNANTDSTEEFQRSLQTVAAKTKISRAFFASGD